MSLSCVARRLLFRSEEEREELLRHGVPSARNPSDHVPVGAIFRWKEANRRAPRTGADVTAKIKPHAAAATSDDDDDDDDGDDGGHPLLLDLSDWKARKLDTKVGSSSHNRGDAVALSSGESQLCQEKESSESMWERSMELLQACPLTDAQRAKVALIFSAPDQNPYRKVSSTPRGADETPQHASNIHGATRNENETRANSKNKTPTPEEIERLKGLSVQKAALLREVSEEARVMLQEVSKIRRAVEKQDQRDNKRDERKAAARFAGRDDENDQSRRDAGKCS